LGPQLFGASFAAGGSGVLGRWVSLLAVSINTMPPDFVESPVQELLWPAFRDGQLQGNLGNLIDLHGLASLLPLFLI